MKQPPPALDDKALLALTREGERELGEPGTKLTPIQLEALVLIDGQSTVEQVVKRASRAAPAVLREGLGELINMGLVCAGANLGYDALDVGDFFSAASVHASTAEAGEQTRADADTEFLRRNGYCVNLARHSDVTPKRTDGSKLTVLVVDDDPSTCTLLRMYLKLEGLDTRVATNRDEIVAAFRQAPIPDLVLLDVWLPDVNGFNILAKIRQHPMLKSVPVIMVTASATREAVLQGIQGGADGYITKPFNIHPLVRAVKEVLGVEYNPDNPEWDFSL